MKTYRRMNNRGMTLVEMIVSFALLGILVVAGANIIYSCSQIYYDSRSQSRGVQVSQLIMEKLKSELEPASAKELYRKSVPVVARDGRVEYSSVNGVHSIISVDGFGKFRIDYPEEGTSWSFPEAVYDGYEIKSLSFEKCSEDYPKNVIRVRLAISNINLGDYEAEEFITFRNLREADTIE